MNKLQIFSRCGMAMLAVLLTQTTPVFATVDTYYWDPGQTLGTGSGGTGAWDDTTANWSYSGAVADTATPVDPAEASWTTFPGFYYVPTFGGTAGTVTVSINGEIDANLRFNTAGYTLNANNVDFWMNNGLTVNSGAGSADTTVNFRNFVVQYSGTFTNNSTGSLVLNGKIGYYFALDRSIAIDGGGESGSPIRTTITALQVPGSLTFAAGAFWKSARITMAPIRCCQTRP